MPQVTKFFLNGRLALFHFCYGKIYRFFRVVVIWNIFIRKLSHLTISSPFILVNQKMYKNHSSFWNRFCLLLAFTMRLLTGTFVIYYMVFF